MAARPEIVALDGEPLNPGDISWQPISDLGNLKVYAHTEPDAVPERVAGADIVLVNKVELKRREIPALRGCRMAGVLATGSNNLDLPLLADAGILACNVPGYGPEDVAQHALALILELSRGTALHTASVKAGDWSRQGWCYWLKPQASLVGLNLGIIGFGAIGRALGKYGNALGMNILAWSRNRKENEEYPVHWAEIADIFQSADIISLHCPLAPETENLVDAKNIAGMKTGAIIINTARGALVREEDVAAALHSGKLGGYGADVLRAEPPTSDNPLLTAPNTLITPHLAWATARARQNIIDIMAENIKAFLAGNVKNGINRPTRGT